MGTYNVSTTEFDYVKRSIQCGRTVPASGDTWVVNGVSYVWPFDPYDKQADTGSPTVDSKIGKAIFSATNQITRPAIADRTSRPAMPLAYNPADPDCVFARTLYQAPTNNPAWNEVGNCTVTAGTASYAGDLGATLGANGLKFTGISGLTAAVNKWMVCFKLPRHKLAVLNGSAAGQDPVSGGVALAGNNDIGVIAPNLASLNGSSPRINAGIYTTKALSFSFGYGSGTGSIGGAYTDAGSALEPYVSNVSTLPYFVQVIFTQSGDKIGVYVDGVLVANATQASMPALLKEIQLGANGSIGAVPNDLKFKELMVIVGRSPLDDLTVLTPSLAVFGDSYSQDINNIAVPGLTNSSGGRSGNGVGLRQYLAKRGYVIPSIYDNSNPGHRIIGWNGAAPVNCHPADAQVFPTNPNLLFDKIAPVLTNNPISVLFASDTNDCGFGVLDGAALLRWKMYIFEKLLGKNGNAATSVQNLVINTTPWAWGNTNTSTTPNLGPAYRLAELKIARLTSYKARDLLVSQYPELNGHVIVNDLYNQFGGDNTTILGQFMPDSGQADTLHPIPKGKHLQGMMWAESLIQLLVK